MKFFCKTPYFVLRVTLLIGVLWFFKGPSDQELFANMAKAADFHPWTTWWSGHFMSGGSVAPQLTTLFTILPLKLFGFFWGPLVGGKIAGLIALACAGLAMNFFLCAWTKNELAGLFGAFAYMIGPQMSLRLGENEHLPVVFSMVYAPLVLWSLWKIVAEQRWSGSLVLALSYGALLLTFTKMAICFLPVALGFAVILIFQRRKNLERVVVVDILFKILIAAALLIPLVILPLLPALREYPWLALFAYEPFQQCQTNFAPHGGLAFLDRACFITAGMPLNFNLDHGGFYLGIITIILTWNIFASHKKVPAPLKETARVSIALLLISAWFSLGPICFVSRALSFLRSSQELQNIMLPLFWIMFAAPGILIWKLWPSRFNQKQHYVIRIGLIFFFFFVPGFKILELLPFAQGIRAPWSVWQLGGAIFVAALVGCTASFFITAVAEKKWQTLRALLVLFLITIDFSPYLFCYSRGALKNGCYDDFLKATDFLKQDSTSSSVMAFSGRYFYLQIPSLTNHPLVDEAFNRYFELKWIRALQNISNPNQITELFNLLGVTYIFVDKDDVTVPQQIQNFHRALYPVVFENNTFVIFKNPNSFYPGFVARDFVVFPKNSYMMTSASLQLASINLLTLEMSQANPKELGFAGMAQANNQIELLPNYKEHGGAPFQRMETGYASCGDEQQMTCHVSPATSGWLVLTKAFHPDWTGSVDGQPAKIVCAAGALLSLYVPLGSQEIVLKFAAPWWYTFSFYSGMLAWIFALTFFYLFSCGLIPHQWKNWLVKNKILKSLWMH